MKKRIDPLLYGAALAIGVVCYAAMGVLGLG